MQENPEDVPVGELPRNMQLVVDRSLVQRIVPGTRVTIVGIFAVTKPAKTRGDVRVRTRRVKIVV